MKYAKNIALSILFIVCLTSYNPKACVKNMTLNDLVSIMVIGTGIVSMFASVYHIENDKE